MNDLNAFARELRHQIPVFSERALAGQRVRLLADPRARVSSVPRPFALPALALGAAFSVALVLFVAVRFEVFRTSSEGSSLTASSARSSSLAPQAAAPLALDGPVRQSLEDGTTIRLDGGAQGKVAPLSAQGRRFDLERGRAHFDVAPQRGATFSVHAGEREIAVLGTRFSVTFEPPSRLLVDVQHGLVAVREPGAPEIRLKAGDRFDSALARSADAAAGSPRDDGEAAAPSVAPSGLKPASPGPGSGRAAPSPARWNELYRLGKYSAALAAARELGLARLHESLGARELSELADTARLAGSSAEALATLNALERRFPSSEQGRQARFLIGRVLLNRGDQAGAIASFEKYLAANPQGTYSTEALGRLLEFHARRGDARARELAERYLTRAPHGSYQRLARSVLSRP